ncbi:hypothetical protein [Polymorphospora sp. NPDC050346]
MTTNEDDEFQPELPDPSDDTAEAEVVAHCYEQTEDIPGCPLFMEVQ